MKNGISTKLTYIDLETILKHYEEPEFWGKEWLIFKDKYLELSWRISCIDCKDMKIISVVKAKRQPIHIGGKQFVTHDWCCNVLSVSEAVSPIPINNKEYNQTIFQNELLATSIRVIERVERGLLSQTYEYKYAIRLDDEEKDTLREIAESFLDSEGVTNKDIREAYIDSYVDKNSNNRGFVLLNHSKYRFFKTAYIHICSWFNNEKAMEREMKEAKDNSIKFSKKNLYEMWKKHREIQTDEWRSAMEDELESIY